MMPAKRLLVTLLGGGFLLIGGPVAAQTVSVTPEG